MPVSGIGSHITQHQFTHWLQSPHLVNAECISALEELAHAYPWFAQAHALLALAKKNSGAPDFQNQLHQAALRAPDRRFIYHLLETPVAQQQHEVAIVEEPIVEENVVVENIVEEITVETTPIEDWVDVLLEDIPVVVVDEDWVDIQLDIAQEKNGNVNESESERIEPTSLPESVEFSELGELGQDILNKAISSSIELEVSEKEAPAAPQPVVTNYDDDFLNFIAHSIGELAEPSNHNEGWTEPAPKEEANATASVNPIIEKFIQNEPQINRGKAVEYAAGNMAKESLEEDVNLVTETMAKLYVKQGKLDKARKAYKKLIELYPEKSVYFAGQLKNLNKKN
jgi:tetratricopeptide (TPR) repeat protein